MKCNNMEKSLSEMTIKSSFKSGISTELHGTKDDHLWLNESDTGYKVNESESREEEDIPENIYMRTSSTSFHVI